ncbi:MAG: oxidoreductase [Ornithinimicrobium sp.]
MAAQSWSTSDIGDLDGKVAVVTGGNAGLGLSTVHQLIKHGAHVVVASRNVERGQGAVDSLGAQPGTAEVLRLDLADLSSVEEFADNVIARHTRLDLLINNAGIMMVPPGETIDGFEQQIGINHFGHFALTGRLIDLIRSTDGARVVSVSSLAHTSGRIDVDNVDSIHEVAANYSKTKAYGNSKLANLLFAYELQRRLAAHNVEAISVAAHPGVSSTGLGDHLIPDRFKPLARPVFELITQPPDAGALPTLRAATDPNAWGGQFFGPASLGQSRGAPVVVASSDASYDAATAAKLWESSQRLTGVNYL